MEADTSPCRCNPIEDGGFAFPCPLTSDGMTLRDYFAAHALAGLWYAHLGSGSLAEDAGKCFQMADAMLDARKVKP